MPGKKTLDDSFPATAQDLIRRLLTPNAIHRLGNLSGGIQDIMSHPMFNEVDFNWRELYAKRMVPPHKPKVRGRPPGWGVPLSCVFL